jgi:hypothetical protein
MPTTRRRIARPLIRGAIPEGALWWLQHGRSLGIAEAISMGLTERGAWQTYLLHYDHGVVASSRFWSRQDCRDAGYGAAIDTHVQAGRCPPDGWRAGPTALVLPFRGP